MWRGEAMIEVDGVGPFYIFWMFLNPIGDAAWTDTSLSKKLLTPGRVYRHTAIEYVCWPLNIVVLSDLWCTWKTLSPFGLKGFAIAPTKG